MTGAFGLPNELVRGESINSRNIADYAASSIEYARARKSHKGSGDGGVVAFFLDSNILFSLARNSVLFKTGYSEKEMLNRWPLTRWPYESQGIEKGVYQMIDFAGGDVDNLVNDDYFLKGSKNNAPIGCLHNSPLRYGDIDSDEINEIVLFLGNSKYKHDFVAFSPNRERIVFSMRYAVQDFTSVDFGSFQYIQSTRQLHGSSGKRIYAKAYFGDFDKDNNPDVLVWRKRFESNDKDSSVPGFHLDQQVWQHYERDMETQASFEQGVTGEYLPQETTEVSQIQTWLSENNHTWQTGYPSKSECPGKEGQLIPEMHDPLLNDPDVLR